MLSKQAINKISEFAAQENMSEDQFVMNLLRLYKQRKKMKQFKEELLRREQVLNEAHLYITEGFHRLDRNKNKAESLKREV